MNTIIQSPDFTASAALLSFVRHNVNKLESFSDQISECRVCLKLDQSDKKENKVCEIKLFVPGDNFFASRPSHSFEEATIKTIDAIKHQLVRWKDSRVNKAGASSFPIDVED